MFSISIVMPAYNEEDIVGKAIEDIYKFTEGRSLVFEVVAVDDGSTDKTREVLESLKNEFKNLRVIHRETNGGVGAAIKTGISASVNDYILVFEADRQYDINDLDKFIPFLNRGEDVMVSIRVSKDTPRIRRLYSSLYRVLVRLLFGIKSRDVNSVFKIVRRDILQNINVRTDDGVYPLDLMLILEKKCPNIIEIPINFYRRKEGKSKICTFRKILPAGRTFIKLFYRHLKNI